MKLTLKTTKPRNPVVVPCLRRAAGPHQGRAGAQRQQAKLAARREMAGLDHRHPHTT